MLSRFISTVMLTFGVTAALAVLGGIQGGYPWPPTLESVPDWWLPAAWSGVEWVWSNTDEANWILLVVGVAILAAPILLGVVSRSSRRDPKRMFEGDERRVGFARSGNRCEMDNWLLMRCHRRAEHGDHWLPWSKGGRSSMANFVSACAKHNLAKSAHWPTWGQTTRISMRRKRYFPAGYTTRPGERY